MRKLIVPLIGIVAVALVGITSVGAQSEPVISIPVDTDIRAEEGSTTELSTVAVDPDLVGATCDVHAEAGNNSSVHPGNDIIIESGGKSVRLVDVEGVSGKRTTATSTLVLGETVTVSLEMGPDERFSAGLFVIECEGGPATTTTTAPPPSSSSTSSTTTSPTILPPSSTSTTSTVPTEVLPEVQESPSPTPVAGTPTFTG